ncbi:ABC transporter ATP-binding protein [Henriciella algicola]|uniref:ABC transporter ATP-binding protein n=1 Tax=Henriciella algicola TaxID=1608422 RepID=A0A399RI51_9PROT|nr:ABC transporter ATP-binding protein [Henriciella algicola]RIJ31326.1 ABC transporter ATP-binding protein [Henriciella algicola]
MAELLTRDLTVIAGKATLVRAANLSLRTGELVALLGPNGAGKTSLLRSALGLEKRATGSALLNGADSERLSPMQRARQVAYLPQQRPLAWPNTVRDVIALGRFAYGAAPGRLSAADAEAVDRAIGVCDLSTLTERQADTLSGGELARVHCARAFAAEAPLLVADEPVAALDPRHQFRIMDMMRTFVNDGGGALVVLHDIALAARYADRMVWMKDAEIVADGSPEDTLTTERMAEIYGVRARIDGRSVEIEGAI